MNEFDLLLNSLTTGWMIPGIRARAQSLGIRFTDWPEGVQKDFVRRFERQPDKRAVVEFEIAQWERSLAVRPGPLPDDDLELKATYQRHLNREIAKSVTQLLKADPERVFEICANVREQRSLEFKIMADEIMRLAESKQAKLDSGENLKLIPGFENLSRAFGGVSGGRVMILGAESGFGKTTAALNFALKASSVGEVLFVNQEMNFDDLLARAVQIEGGVTSTEWNEWKFNHQVIVDVNERMLNRKSIVASLGSSVSLDEITGAIAQRRPFLTIIDYDQKIATPGGVDEWRALNLVIQRLEESAKTFDAFVILLSQFTKDGEIKASKRMFQSATSVVWFKTEGDRTFFEFTKNRFGSGLESRVEVNYDRATGQISEIGMVKKPKEPAGERKRIYS